MDIITSIKTKADAMTFAIEQSGGDLGKADQIYRMFVDNMELPDAEATAADSCFKKLKEAADALTRRVAEYLSEKSDTQPRAVPCHIGQTKVDEKAYDGIILPGMPHLEWMTENLSGFGGTEIDGRWYYTYDEAMAAAEQLGDGWRLPTREEFVQLCDLGSEWRENGPHGLPGRLFGGGLFLEAAGYRSDATGALEYVGTNGYAWSSSSYAAGNVGAGMLSFTSGNVNPLLSGNRAIARAVRCVRNRQ